MTVDAMYAQLSAKFMNMLPAADLRRKAELACEINALKAEKNAVILGHNYMDPILFHSVPDYTGDSLQLSRQAAHTDRDIIVFCGVKFMAETAKILNPEKTVLIPEREVGCSLAASITAEDVRTLKHQFPGVPVVTYINTYADVKAESDLCCTSGNAAAVVESLQSDTVIFLPDEFLADNVARQTGKHIIFPTPLPSQDLAELDYQMLGWRGRCEVHERFTPEDLDNIRRHFPDAYIMTHPECHPDVAAASDFCGSTSAMIRTLAETSRPQYVLLTESAMAENLAAMYPQKEILQLCQSRCPYMAEITLENTLEALQRAQYVVEVPDDIRRRAVKAVERMLAIG
jgi:quinolinate synthase